MGDRGDQTREGVVQNYPQPEKIQKMFLDSLILGMLREGSQIVQKFTLSCLRKNLEMKCCIVAQKR